VSLNAVFAGDFKVSSNTIVDVPKTTRVMQSGKVNDKVYVINYDWRGKYSMMIFDSNMKLINDVIFKQRNDKDEDVIGRGFAFKTAMFMKSEILLFFETYETSTKKQLLLVQKTDLNGKFVGKMTSIDNIPANKRYKQGSFELEHSEDSTKFLVIKHLPYDKKAEEEFGFRTFDSNLDMLGEKTVNLPYREKNTSVIDFYLSNRGDVYMLLKVDLERKEKVKGEDDEFYSLLCQTISSNKALREYKLNLPQKDIVSIAFRIDNKTDRVLCSGFYSDIRTNTSHTRDIDGFFYLTADINTQKIVSQSYKQIDSKIVNQLRGKSEDKKVKEGKGIAVSFRVKDYVSRSDGSSVIVAENSWVTVVTTCQQRGGCTTTTYYDRTNIFLIAISSNGEVQAFYDIPKRQSTINDGGYYSSFSLMKKDDRIIFVYNDNPKNVGKVINSIKDVKAMRNPGMACLVAVEIANDGEIIRHGMVYDRKKTKMTAIPLMCNKIANGEYIIPTYKRKQIGLLKFEL
jgi:hypothetical protein